MSLSYLLLIVLSLAIGGGAQFYVNRNIKKYQAVPASSGVSGAEVAQRMLSAHGIHDVQIKRGGANQDFFDPRSNSITLDPDAFDGRSITANATACHEVGHACQYAEGYAPMKVRSALVPIVNFASNAWVYVLLIGMFLNIIGLVNLAIAFYAVAVLFQIVTLPVEFNASHRALDFLKSTGVPQSEELCSYKVLRSCALTYVAAALVSAIQLIWLLSERR
ncbi:MAG: zinc metallopeptidase [Eggerthellaceae bacterium]|nr:zinc metallopeptidase [Eggerthellaceae bacterium]MCH4220570.1 zinc metallopeptidase [Eggerthellaceae bacterium]